MFNEYTGNGGGFYFRSVAYNRKLVDETIGVLLKRAFLSIVIATLPSYGRGFVLLSLPLSLSLSLSRFDDYRSLLKQTIFPDETLARSPLSYRFVPASTRVMKITRVSERERERGRWEKDKLKLLRDSFDPYSRVNFVRGIPTILV